MHDYTLWKVHNDRLRERTEEADAFRLAAIARAGRPRRHPGAIVRRWLSSIRADRGGASSAQLEGTAQMVDSDAAARVHTDARGPVAQDNFSLVEGD